MTAPDKLAARLALVASAPAIYISVVAFVLSLIALGLTLDTREKMITRNDVCSTLQKESVIYVKQAQLDDKAQTRAAANALKLGTPDTKFWLGQGLISRSLALQNAALCGFPKTDPTPTPDGRQNGPKK